MLGKGRKEFLRVLTRRQVDTMRENVNDDICEKYTVVRNNALESRVNSCFARFLARSMSTMASDVLAEEMEVCRIIRM